MNYKITFFGVKDTTQTIIDFLISKEIVIDLIVTIKSDNENHLSGYKDFKNYYSQKQIQVYEVESYDLKSKKDKHFFQNNSFEIGISLGWQRLIPAQILSNFKFGIYGFHGSSGYLPFGRGRSPLNWSLIKGDKRFILNLFRYDEFADSPNVYKNVMWEINEHDDIRTMQYKNMIVAKRLLLELIRDYKIGNILIENSSNDFDFWYKKRSPEDGKIDFKKRTVEIYNLIRAVTRPFPGAYAFVNDHKIIIWKAKPFDIMLDFRSYKPGEIIDIYDGNLIVRTLDGSMVIYEYDTYVSIERGNVFE